MKAILAEYLLDTNKVLKNKAVLIEGNVIYDIVDWKKTKDHDVDEIYGGKGYLLIPGLINAHTHVAMTKFRGLGDDLPLDIWLNEVIWPMEKEWSKREIYRWALIGIAEAISNGSTTINDHYFFANEIAKAAKELGVRAFIGHTVMDIQGPETMNLKKGFKFFKKWKKEELITSTLAPHASDTCSKELLDEIREFAEKENALIHMHVSQSKEEILRVKRREGLLPVEYLEDVGILGKNFIGVHGVYLNEKEVKIYSQSGATLVHCPTSLAKLEGEIAPIIALWEKGTNIALGNDCAVSNNTMDMILEMKFAAILNKVKTGDPAKAKAKEVFYWATLGGAKALGIKAGLIEKGYLADLVLINTKKLHFLPGDNILSHLVYSARGGDVERVFVNGNLVYDPGKFTKLLEFF